MMKFPFPTLLLTLGFVMASSLGLAQKVQTRPVQPTSATSGSAMFREYCAVCHGDNATGDGPAAKALRKTPANLTELQARNKGVFPADHVYNVIKGDPEMPAHGSKDMPVWGSVFSSLARGNAGEVQLRISNLVEYVRGVQVSK